MYCTCTLYTSFETAPVDIVLILLCDRMERLLSDVLLTYYCVYIQLTVLV